MKNKTITKADLEKTASMLRDLSSANVAYEKKAKATELLYKQAELGQIKLPQTHAEFQEKVAELLRKDLDVVEEAIKIASATEEVNSFGRLINGQENKKNAHQQFADFIVNVD